MYDDHIETVELVDEEVQGILDDDNTGELKSQVDYRLGEIRRKGYSIGFRRLAEVHGTLNAPLGDSEADVPKIETDASLIALRITPRTDDPQKRRFESFSITLFLETTGSYQRPPSIFAYEPAAQGAEFFQQRSINVKDMSSLEGNLTFKAPVAAEGGIITSWSNEKTYEQVQRIKLSSFSTGQRQGVDTQVKFTLEPGSDEDGIGDSFAVALIVKRQPGKSFYILAKSEAVVNTRFKDVLPSKDKQDLKNGIRLGPFPISTSDGEPLCPDGVDIKNLRLASNEILKGLAYVHVPEKGKESLFLTQQDSSVPGDAEKTPSEEPVLPVVATTPTKDTTAKQTTASSEGCSGSRSLLSIQNSRAVRLRLMASHHQSLAKLYLEEAETVEALVEMSHSDPGARSPLFQS